MTIKTPLGLEACRSRLQETTKPDSLRSIFSDSGTILCSFSGDRFRLRQKKWYNNSFEPLFYGRLTPNPGGTEVTGDFRMRLFVKVFMAVWFGMLTLFLVEFVIKSIQQRDSAPSFLALLSVPLMAAFGVGLVAVGKRLGKSQQEAMIQFLDETFSSNVPTIAPRPSLASQSKMTGAILAFLGFGLMSICFSVIGISNVSAHTNSPGGTAVRVAHFAGGWYQALAFAQGLFLCFLAYGTWKRLYVAWILGLVLIALSVVSFFSQIGAMTGPDQSPWPVWIFIGVGGLAIGAYWTMWWYRKRSYFLK
jgi:hypothetical protein